jgi:hypothetical protein
MKYDKTLWRNCGGGMIHCMDYKGETIIKRVMVEVEEMVVPAVALALALALAIQGQMAMEMEAGMEMGTPGREVVMGMGTTTRRSRAVIIAATKRPTLQTSRPNQLRIHRKHLLLPLSSWSQLPLLPPQQH